MTDATFKKARGTAKYNLKIGDVYHGWTIISGPHNIQSPSSRVIVKWECRCECGRVDSIMPHVLYRGPRHICVKRASHDAMIGRGYGWLTIVSQFTGEYPYKFDKGPLWSCRCKCGTEVVRSQSTLANKHVASCGCYNSFLFKSKSLSDMERSVNYLWNSYLTEARRRNKFIGISKDEFEKLTQSPCFYCGHSPSGVTYTHGNKLLYRLNGVDRVDSSLGYLPDNVVPCCGPCNRAKGTSSKSDFIEWIDRLVAHRQKVLVS